MFPIVTEVVQRLIDVDYNCQWFDSILRLQL